MLERTGVHYDSDYDEAAPPGPRLLTRRDRGDDPHLPQLQVQPSGEHRLRHTRQQKQIGQDKKEISR